jgi:hypothetical protein
MGASKLGTDLIVMKLERRRIVWKIKIAIANIANPEDEESIPKDKNAPIHL